MATKLALRAQSETNNGSAFIACGGGHSSPRGRRGVQLTCGVYF